MIVKKETNSQTDIPKISKRELHGIFLILSFDSEMALNRILEYSTTTTLLYDNLDLLLKLTVATDASRNQFFCSEEHNRLFVANSIESIRYQSSFEDLCTWCTPFKDELQANHVLIVLWILGTFAKRGFSWVKEITRIEFPNEELYKLPSNFLDLNHLRYINLKGNQINSHQLSFHNFSELQTLILDENSLLVFPDIRGCALLQNLDLSYNHIQHVPPEIGDHKLLQKLNLSFNKISTLPTTIGDLRDLQEFIFCDNLIQSLPEEITNCHNLETLCGFKNYIRTLPQNINKMTSLRFLELDDNEIESLPDNICYLSQLTKINLQENFLLSLPEKFGELSNLSNLDVSCNQLLCLPSSLSKLCSLKSIHFTDNPFLSFLNKPLHQHTQVHLKEIYLDMIDILIDFFSNYLDTYDQKIVIQHDIQEENFFMLHILPELLVLFAVQNGAATKSLSLHNTQLSRIPYHLRNCIHIETLDLSVNQIKRVDHELHGCTNLQDINLSTNKLKTIHIEISNMPQLRSVDLSNNKIKSMFLHSEVTHCHIEELCLINNKLKHWPSDIFSYCHQLQKIHCANNQLPSIPSKIKHLTKLRTFCAQHNKITDISSLTTCIHLEHINLEDNQITHIPKELFVLPKLRYLNIKSNHITSLPNIKAPSLEYLFVQEYHFVGAESSVLNRLSMAILDSLCQNWEKIEDTERAQRLESAKLHSEAALKIARKRNDLFGYAFAGLQFLDVKAVMFHNNPQKNLSGLQEDIFPTIVQPLLKIHWQEVRVESLKKGWLNVCDVYPKAKWSQELRNRINKKE